VNENDLREALRTTLTAVPEPPPMDSTAALGHGRRAVRRRTALAGAGATAALAAAAVLAVSVAPNLIGGGGGQPVSVQPAGPPPSAAPYAPKKVWPTEAGGKPQQDATARSGPRYERGKRVFERLLAVVPAGYTTPTGSVEPADGPKAPASDSSGAVPLQDHQAAVENGDSWSYLSSVAVARKGGTGRLMVEVHTPGNGLPSEPCALARQFWGMGGQCQVKTVGTAKVGVVVKPAGDDRLDQWAAYRYSDGIVVFVAQSRNAANVDSTLAPLSTLPLTVAKLAALATDQRFHVD
jgi:hypothetical protein